MDPSKIKAFQRVLKAAKHIVVLTGAGVSAESGIPTFRGAGGLWRKFDVTKLATPEAFENDPSLVWEFYSYRRDIVHTCKPNPGHIALAGLEQKCQEHGKRFTLLTQNIDRLHQAAGSKNVIEMHGSLWLVKPVGHSGFLEEKGLVWEDRTQPLVPALLGRGTPDAMLAQPSIPVDQLPHSPDGKLLRPAVVWFGEMLDDRVSERQMAELMQCDLFMVVGTSAVVYPAAGFIPFVKERGGATVAEVNLEATPNSKTCDFTFQGQSGELLPALFDIDWE